MKKILIASLTLIAGVFTHAQAQPNPLIAQYYSNRYLGNPAFAGLDDQLTINLGYRSQWNDIPGAPVMQNFSADYGFKKAGLGIQAIFDQAGLERTSRIVGSYAYHLPLDERGSLLHFGISLGILSQRLAQNGLEGAPNDPSVAAYNQRESYIDGDFGIAFTSSRINLEAALPNLKQLFTRDQAQMGNMSSFYTAISYTIPLGEAEVQPKLAYRGIRGLDNILDAGAQFSFASKQVMLTALYHSTKTASFGVAMDYKRKYLLGLSHTLQTGALNQYTNGIFEISLRGRF